MRIAVAFALALLLVPVSTNACSTFCLRDGGTVVYGRNYDFDVGTGVVLVNPRGVQKTSLPKLNSSILSWTSKYGSVTFNQFGKDFPMDGMNEAGLVVALMWLDGSVYPADDARPALGVLEWIQVQLDRYATVSEVLAHAEETRVRGGTPLHYLIADASGDAATIEYLGGTLVVHRGSSLPTANLTNDSYDASLQYLRGFSEFGGTRAMPSGSGSLDRFARTAILMARPAFGRSPVDRTFDILASVAQRGSTRWSVAYDTTNGEVTWTTDVTPARKSLRLGSLDFSCSSSVVALNVRSELTGDVVAQLSPYSHEANLAQMLDAYASSALLGEVSRSWIEQSAAHVQGFSCVPQRRQRAVRK